MVTTKQISKNVVKIISDSNCYIVEGKYLIDTSRKELKNEIKQEISKYANIDNIKKIIFTHLHYDHIGCFDLFQNADFYANKSALESMKNNNNKINMVLNQDIANKFNINLQDIEKCKELKDLFKIKNTPGHSSSCIILYYKKDNVLFTGDTYFKENCYGRTDLPTSEPDKMADSIKLTLEIINKYNPIIAPGHDY